MKKLIIFFLFFIFIWHINAIEGKLGWSIGTWGVSYDFINKKTIQQFELLRFNWIMGNNYGLGFTLFEIRNTYKDNDTISYSILPIEFSYNPWNYEDFLYLSFYGRIGLQFIQRRSIFQKNIFDNFFTAQKGVYGTIGTRLFIFSQLNWYYAYYISIFFEYNIPNELKFGFSWDLVSLIAAVLSSWKENVEEERANEWEKKPDRNKDRRDIPK